MELKTLKIDSDIEDFLECYKYNSLLIGEIYTTEDVYVSIIKLLTIFPLKNKKLKYFINLSPIDKFSYILSYIITISKKIKISNILISDFRQYKINSKKYRNLILTPEQVGCLLNTDLKEFIKEYGNVVRDEIYHKILLEQVIRLSSLIFERYDYIKKDMIKRNNY